MGRNSDVRCFNVWISTHKGRGGEKKLTLHATYLCEYCGFGDIIAEPFLIREGDEVDEVDEKQLEQLKKKIKEEFRKAHEEWEKFRNKKGIAPTAPCPNVRKEDIQYKLKYVPSPP